MGLCGRVLSYSIRSDLELHHILWSFHSKQPLIIYGLLLHRNGSSDNSFYFTTDQFGTVGPFDEHSQMGSVSSHQCLRNIRYSSSDSDIASNTIHPLRSFRYPAFCRRSAGFMAIGLTIGQKPDDTSLGSATASVRSSGNEETPSWTSLLTDEEQFMLLQRWAEHSTEERSKQGEGSWRIETKCTFPWMQTMIYIIII